jgi:cytoskeletal protein RodZ
MHESLTQLYQTHKRSIMIGGGILLVVIVAAVGYVVWQKHHQPKAIVTPAQTLEDLRLQSAPDTKTTAQKTTTLNALEKGAPKPTLTRQQQLNMLNQINK